MSRGRLWPDNYPRAVRAYHRAFQLVQELVVKIAIRMQTGRLLYQHAAGRLDAGEDARTACSMSKLHCTESAITSASDMVQLFGAAGLDEGTIPERCFRDAREATIPEGTSQMRILNIGRSLPRTSLSARRILKDKS